jgi:Arc/MetJ-type ribon-helix-helix transcriptional regulator
MNALPSDVQEFIDAEITNRTFASREDLIAEAVRQLRSRKQQLERLRQELQQARDELDRGEGIELSDERELVAFFDDILARGRERSAACERTR